MAKEEEEEEEGEEEEEKQPTAIATTSTDEPPRKRKPANKTKDISTPNLFPAEKRDKTNERVMSPYVIYCLFLLMFSNLILQVRI